MEIDSDLKPPPSLGRMLNLATGAMNRMCQAMLEPHGLMLAQWVVLSALWRRDGQLVSELARYSGNNVPAASRIVDRMARGGLVRRRGDGADRRAVRVHLTEAGRDLSRLAGFWRTVNARLLDGFTDDEAAVLFAMLERIAANARAAAPADDHGGDH